MEVVLRSENDVCVGALSVNFTILYFKWFVLHFPVGVTGLLLSSQVSALLPSLLYSLVLCDPPIISRQ